MKRFNAKRWFCCLTAGLMLLATTPEAVFSSAEAITLKGLPEGTTVGETIYENDFTQKTLDALTTSDIGNGWQWKPDTGSVAFEEQGGLCIHADGGTKTVAFPALGTLDYVYTATVEVLSDGGSFGLLTDLPNPVTEALGGTHSGLYVGDATNYGVYQYNRVSEMYYEQSYKNSISLLGAVISKGDECSLSVYSIDGTAYFYVDGVFVASTEAYFGESVCDVVGFYACNADVIVKTVCVKELSLRGVTETLSVIEATVRYADGEGYTSGSGSMGLRFTAKVDKTAEDYQSAVPSGNYDPASTEVKFGMLLLPTDLLSEDEILNKDTRMVLDVPMRKIESQTNTELRFSVSLLDIPEEELTRSFTARVYMKVKKDGVWEYSYAKNSQNCVPVNVGNGVYEDIEDEAVRARLDKIFKNTMGYYGGNASRITFALFADFHYVENCYMSSVADLAEIFRRAAESNADFVLHAGDFCNDYTRSPEIVNAYLNNAYNMPAYGIYGNHELEGSLDTMAKVTPSLTNRADEVSWGTEDGKIGDGSIGYYYFDVNGIRVICTDTNYSWNPTKNVWEHREQLRSNSGNTQDNSFGAPQRAWLKKILNDAADKDMSCIVVSHHANSGLLKQTPSDGKEVRQIFKEVNEKRAGTVLMMMNGHLHTDHLQIVDDVLYFDVNTVRNGQWINGSELHYGNLTFNKVSYDDNGLEIETGDMLLNDLSQGKNTWFFSDPLSTIVTVSSSGRIKIEGMQTTWFGGVEPPEYADGTTPRISAGVFDMPVD